MEMRRRLIIKLRATVKQLTATHLGRGGVLLGAISSKIFFIAWVEIFCDGRGPDFSPILRSMCLPQKEEASS